MTPAMKKIKACAGELEVLGEGIARLKTVPQARRFEAIIVNHLGELLGVTEEFAKIEEGR